MEEDNLGQCRGWSDRDGALKTSNYLYMNEMLLEKEKERERRENEKN